MNLIHPRMVLLTLALAVGSIVLAGCGRSQEGEGPAGAAADKQLTLANVNWADGVALTNLAKVILEDRLGYEVEIVTADPGPVYVSVAEGDNDAFLDAWLPITHEDYMERFGDQLEDLGINYANAKLGLVVPADAPGQTIADLADHADAYGRRIEGIDSGAGIMRNSRKAIEVYGLDDYQLISSSGPAMTAALSVAIDDDRPIVVTGWKPHWKFARWNLRFLEDPENVYGDAENIHTVARLGFSEDHPDAAAFLRAYQLNDQQLGSLMGAIKDSDEAPDVVARQWMSEHEDLVAKWLADVEAAASAGSSE